MSRLEVRVVGKVVGKAIKVLQLQTINKLSLILTMHDGQRHDQVAPGTYMYIMFIVFYHSGVLSGVGLKEDLHHADVILETCDHLATVFPDLY